MAENWRECEKIWVIGCIGHDGAISARADSGEKSFHSAEESRGKRWRWNIHTQSFGTTLSMLKGNLDGITREEYAIIADWLAKNNYMSEAECDFYIQRANTNEVPQC